MTEKRLGVKRFCIIFSIMFFLFFLLQKSYAANIQIVRNAPTEINFGDILEVNISINNLENSELWISVKEHIANADPVYPESFYTERCPVKFCVEYPFYEWNVTIPSLSTYTITYQVKPKGIGIFSIGPTEVTTSSGQLFESDALVIKVHCIANGICEPNKGENYITCPEDCPSGSADGVCDLVKDGRCDPDCAPGTDPDCITTTAISSTTTTPIGKPSTPTYIYIIFIAIIIAAAAFLLLRVKIER
jgi:hypothetical protein